MDPEESKELPPKSASKNSARKMLVEPAAVGLFSSEGRNSILEGSDPLALSQQPTDSVCKEFLAKRQKYCNYCG